MNSPLSIIIGREYFERVRRRSFIITTLLMPLLMVGLIALPVIFAMVGGTSHSTIGVVDESGTVFNQLRSGGDIEFVRVDGSFDEACQNADYDMVLKIDSNIVADTRGASLYTRDASSMQLEGYLRSQLVDIVRHNRMEAYDMPDLQRIIEDLDVDVPLATYRMTEGDEAQEQSSMVAYVMGELMSLVLYMFILMYGQMVMTSIIEEKNNRVLELVVSSVKPETLMLGKIIGVGLVAFTQIMIWAVVIAAFAVWGLPVISAGASADMLASLGQLMSPGFILSMCGWMIVLVVGGYLFYSSIYAAVGSAVDNVQDASQLQTVAIMPIIIGMVLSMTVVQDPNSSLAFWASLVPFTSPMVMMARLPFGVPAWEPVVAAVLLYLSVLGMVWLSAKIYRVGILVYGKKPSWVELIRWARYK